MWYWHFLAGLVCGVLATLGVLWLIVKYMSWASGLIQDLY